MIISEISNCVKFDRFLSYELGLTRRVVHDILTLDLGLTKKCARWVPRLLTPAHKAAKVKMAEDFLAKIQADPSPAGFKQKVVTMDESWVSHFQPESKEQSKQWVEKDAR